MITPNESLESPRKTPASPVPADASRNGDSEPHSSEQLPNSTRVYVQGELFADVRVPMREIALSPTKSFNGANRSE